MKKLLVSIIIPASIFAMDSQENAIKKKPSLRPTILTYYIPKNTQTKKSKKSVHIPTGLTMTEELFQLPSFILLVLSLG